jgi:hypothetical protein
VTQRGCYPRFCLSEIAQLAEQLTVNQRVAGSSPALGATIKRDPSPWGPVSFFLGVFDCRSRSRWCTPGQMCAQ